MNIFKKIAFGFKAMKAMRGFEDYDDEKYLDYISGGLTKAGLRINETKSLTISAIYSATTIIAGTIASLPKVVYRSLKTGEKERDLNHPLYDRLHNKPNNSSLTSWQWIFTQIIHKYLWGNWYTYIDRKSYQNIELIPLLPDRTYLDPNNKDRYVTSTESKKIIYIPKEKMLHIAHFSLDGTTSKGVIHYARESLGLSRALDDFAASYFGKGIHGGGFVEVPGSMKKEDREELQRDFNEKYRGLGKWFMTIFLTGNAKFTPADIDAEKAQALQSRQFTVTEVARWMNLAPHILRDLSRSTFSNIEHQGIELVVYSFLPLTTQIEQAMNIAFFDDEERKDHYIKFELKGLLRGDIKSRMEFYKAMIDRGIFNADNVLELEDMNPQPNGLGKIYMVPLNMLNKEQILQPIQLTMNNQNKTSLERKFIKSIYKRSAALRRRLTIAYKKKFNDYGNQVVGKEIGYIREASKKMLKKKGITEFNNWLDGFYQDFQKEIDSLSSPLISSYAASVLPIAQDEINSDADISSQYSTFEREYGEYFIDRHIKSSKGQLKAIVKDSQEAGENVKEAIETRLTEWEEKRPGKISMREPIRAESAFARKVFAVCGITKIISIHYGESCDYCMELDGKVIGIDQYFLTKGNFQPEGISEPLVVTSNCSHPPYHDGCECGIGAEI